MIIHVCTVYWKYALVYNLHNSNTYNTYIVYTRLKRTGLIYEGMVTLTGWSSTSHLECVCYCDGTNKFFFFFFFTEKCNYVPSSTFEKAAPLITSLALKFITNIYMSCTCCLILHVAEGLNPDNN